MKSLTDVELRSMGLTRLEGCDYTVLVKRPKDQETQEPSQDICNENK